MTKKKLVDRFTEKTAHLVPSLEGARHEPITPQKGERIRMVDEKWKERAEKAEAELAEHHKNKRSWNVFMEETFTPEFRNEAGVEYLKSAIEGNEFRIGVLEAELSALKKDVWMAAQIVEYRLRVGGELSDAVSAINRILEATKEEP